MLLLHLFLSATSKLSLLSLDPIDISHFNCSCLLQISGMVAANSSVGVCPSPCGDTPLAIAGNVAGFLTFAYGSLGLFLYYYHVVVNGSDEAAELVKDLTELWEEASTLRVIIASTVDMSGGKNPHIASTYKLLGDQLDSSRMYLIDKLDIWPGKKRTFEAGRKTGADLLPAEYARMRYRSSIRYRFRVKQNDLRDHIKKIQSTMHSFAEQAKDGYSE